MPSAVKQQDANRFHLMREVIRVQKRADCMKAGQSANLGMPFIQSTAIFSDGSTIT
jgi:hypothetical protein